MIRAVLVLACLALVAQAQIFPPGAGVKQVNIVLQGSLALECERQ